MRVTREYISKFVNESVARRARTRYDLQSVYLCGSFLGDEYLLGGSGDVDLVFVYSETPEVAREVVRIADEIHLDILNHDQKEYRDTRALRVDPWLGPVINAGKILYDPGHFLDFVQASVRGQFDRPDHVYQRAKKFAEQGRETWKELLDESHKNLPPEAVVIFLDAVGKAANAIASLSGPPLSERRILLDFPQRMEALGFPGLYQGLLGLLCAPRLKVELLEKWIVSWQETFLSVPENKRPVRFHTERLKYYLGAFSEFINSGRPNNAIWTFVETWSQMATYYPEGSEQRAIWQQVFEEIELAGPALEGRIEALDAFLDTIEETLETWGRKNGV